MRTDSAAGKEQSGVRKTEMRMLQGMQESCSNAGRIAHELKRKGRGLRAVNAYLHALLPAVFLNAAAGRRKGRCRNNLAVRHELTAPTRLTLLSPMKSDFSSTWP